jgi:hypothetical protein
LFQGILERDTKKPNNNNNNNNNNYWVNFATTGEPSTYPEGMSGSAPNWPEFRENSTEYLIINDDIRAGDDYPGTWISSGSDHPEPEKALAIRAENLDVFYLLVVTFIILQYN